jgi:hypothetical protein
MLEFILSIFGLGQASLQRAEERKLHAAAILAKVEATIMECALRLDYEIQRLRLVAANASIPPDMVVASLVTMRAQCDELRKMAEASRSMLDKKGANAAAVAALEQWGGTCSVMPAQIGIGIQQIELAISNGVGRQ